MLYTLVEFGGCFPQNIFEIKAVSDHLCLIFWFIFQYCICKLYRGVLYLESFEIEITSGWIQKNPSYICTCTSTRGSGGMLLNFEALFSINLPT